MTQKLNLGNSTQPLRNVAALSTLIKRVEGRAFGLPGMAVFHGPTGLGKTFACGHAAVHLDAIYVSVDDTWTKKTLLTAILKELRTPPARTIADMMAQASPALAKAGRTLIIDEADDAVDRNLIPTLRHLHDKSSMPIILVGMEKLPQKLRKWELVDGRVLSWVPAETADMRDAWMLAKVYAPGITLDEALMQKIVEVNNGSVRRISVDLAYVTERSRLEGTDVMTLDAWGDAPFLRGSAPMPREGM
jgi:DNA transposition AAA+ family ATPase